MKNKYLSYDDRLEIESGLKQGLSFKHIAQNLNKDCTTISKEIRNHIIIKELWAMNLIVFFRKNWSYRVKGTKCNINSCS